MIHQPYRILAIEDEIAQQQLFGALFPPPEFRFKAFGNAEEFISACDVDEFDVVLLDNGLPGMSGQDLCRYIREGMGQRFVPVIMVTGQRSPETFAAYIEAGASDCIGKPYSTAELTARVRAAARQRRQLAHLDDAESVLFSLARMIEARDGTTGDHCARLAHRARVFGSFVGLEFDDIEALERGAILHDIGKVAVPDAILLKPGPLTEVEWRIMRCHPEIGERLCKPLATMARTLPIIRCHHERWNGQGYPDGLAGKRIPLLARVFQLLDVHDALSNPRHYKPAYNRGQVMAQMLADAHGGHFDPELFDVFYGILVDRPELLEIPEEPVAGGGSLACSGSAVGAAPQVEQVPSTLLCVDDEPGVLSALRRLFRRKGYRILLADSGMEALRIMEREAVDLVISDMRMPEMDGASFLSQVQCRWPGTIRILLTGYASADSMEEARVAGGIHRCVGKPWVDDELLQAVDQLLDRTKS